MDDLIHYCTRPQTKVHQVVHGNSSSLTILQTGMNQLLYCPTHLMKYLAPLVTLSSCRRCGFVEKKKISPNLLNFGLKMFRSF